MWWCADGASKLKITSKGTVRHRRVLGMKLPKPGRRGIFLLLTGLLLLAVLVGNIGLAFVSDAYHWHIDLTDESLYTMSDEFVQELDTLQGRKAKIIFCSEPDVLLANQTTRVVYYMACAMALRYDNITVETVDVVSNPNAVQAYKATSATEIEADSVIISADSGYRVRSASSFWMMDEERSTYWGYMGEYEMATVLLSLLTNEKPIVCVTYGHGEPEPDAAKKMTFYQLIPDKLNAEVVFIDLDKEDIPDHCVLLIMNGVTEDYVADVKDYEGYVPGNDNPASYYGYVSPIEKIERYLDRHSALMVLKDPFVSLPVLEAFLSDWGIGFESMLVKDASNSQEDRTRLVATYADSETQALGHSLYGAIADLDNAPPTIVENVGTLHTTWQDGSHYFSSSYSALYSPVLLSSDKAKGYDSVGDVTDVDGSYHLASVVNRCYTNPDNGTIQYTYVFAAATTALVSDEYIANQAYANAEILFSSMRTMASGRVYSAMDFSINSNNYGGKVLWDITMNEEYSSDTAARAYKYGQLGTNGKTAYKVRSELTDTAKITYTVVVVALPALVTAGVGVWQYVRRRRL